MQSFLTSALLLAAFVAAGVVAIVTIRGRYRKADAEHGSWETALAEYRALRDKGVLTAEEYRKIKILVEPRIDSGVGRTGAGADEMPAARRCG
ncbi:MAG: hypothetical protein WCR51_07700 [Planctomycetia bacterium]